MMIMRNCSLTTLVLCSISTNIDNDYDEHDDELKIYKLITWIFLNLQLNTKHLTSIDVLPCMQAINV